MLRSPRVSFPVELTPILTKNFTALPELQNQKFCGTKKAYFFKNLNS